MRQLVLISVIFILAGCASATRTQHLRVGMPRAEMISVMGNPMSMGGDKDGEVLYYQLLEGGFPASPHTYFVRVVDGKVDSFGRLNELVIPSDSPTPLPPPSASSQ